MVGWMCWGILGTLWRTNQQCQGKHISSAMEVQNDLDNGIKISNLGTAGQTVRKKYLGMGVLGGNWDRESEVQGWWKGANI